MRSVSTVDVIRPPITTVANGRCTSAPADLASAIGRNPRLATHAVMRTGRSRVSAPRLTASSTARPQRQHPADDRERHTRVHDHGIAHGAEGREEQNENQEQCDGYHNEQAL